MDIYRKTTEYLKIRHLQTAFSNPVMDYDKPVTAISNLSAVVPRASEGTELQIRWFRRKVTVSTSELEIRK